MDCPACQHENPDAAKFCGSCGGSPVSRDATRRAVRMSHGATAPNAEFSSRKRARSRIGAGQFIDCSLQECQLLTLLSGPGQFATCGFCR